MTNLKICYIDDVIDNFLSKYLDEYQKHFKNDQHTLEVIEYSFLPEDNYKTLLMNPDITSSSLLLVDSRLFENMTVRESKFTGEQFLVLLKKVLPFIKTIIITQNMIEKESLTVAKFKNIRRNHIKPEEYYDKTLKPILDQKLKEFIEEKEILIEMRESSGYDELLIESIDRSINGLEETALFEKADLDELINVFNEVRNQYGRND